MCGIIGKFSKISKISPLVADDLTALHLRGPDSKDIYSNEYISLGHTRLSIVDLSSQANQPMHSSDGQYTIIYNGEVYNYIELRDILTKKGCHFRTQSDTEVVLESYRTWGEECVQYFRGMFAFAIWDENAKNLFLARDRVGERPLVYYQDESTFYFASELKALVRILPHTPELDLEAVDMYLHYQYVPEPYTPLKNVKKLSAAHVATISRQSWSITPKRYWCVEATPITEQSPPKDTNDILGRIRTGLEDSVKLTLRADVPVAVALSGGIDSGAIAALAQKNYPEPMYAFSVGYPGRPPYDEREQAKALATSLGMIFHEVELPVDEFVSFFPSLVKIMDEPIADPAAFGHYAVPKAAAQKGIKVLLSGIGGDELFWGYSWLAQSACINQKIAQAPKILQYFCQKDTFKPFLRKISNSKKLPPKLRTILQEMQLGLLDDPADVFKVFSLTPDFSYAHTNLTKFYGSAMSELKSDNAYRPVIIGKRRSKEIPAAVTRILFDTWLVSNCLSLGDRVSMGASVETRLPFLEPNLISLVMMLRHYCPDHELGQKAWLRAALKGILPDEVLLRPKSGFQPPIGDWLNGVIGTYGNLLEHGKLRSLGVINERTIELMYSKNYSWPDMFMLYKLLLLEVWWQEVVVK